MFEKPNRSSCYIFHLPCRRYSLSWLPSNDLEPRSDYTVIVANPPSTTARSEGVSPVFNLAYPFVYVTSPTHPLGVAHHSLPVDTLWTACLEAWWVGFGSAGPRLWAHMSVSPRAPLSPPRAFLLQLRPRTPGVMPATVRSAVWRRAAASTGAWPLLSIPPPAGTHSLVAQSTHFLPLCFLRVCGVCGCDVRVYGVRGCVCMCMRYVGVSACV